MEWSRICSFVVSPNFRAIKSSPMRRATSSRDICDSRSRIRGATPLIPSSASTRSARSLAMGISTSVDGSRPAERAFLAIAIAWKRSFIRDFSYASIAGESTSIPVRFCGRRFICSCCGEKVSAGYTDLLSFFVQDIHHGWKACFTHLPESEGGA